MGVFGATRLLRLWEKRQPIRSLRYRNRCGSAAIFRKTATDHDDGRKTGREKISASVCVSCYLLLKGRNPNCYKIDRNR